MLILSYMLAVVCEICNNGVVVKNAVQSPLQKHAAAAAAQNAVMGVLLYQQRV